MTVTGCLCGCTPTVVRFQNPPGSAEPFTYPPVNNGVVTIPNPTPPAVNLNLVEGCGISVIPDATDPLGALISVRTDNTTIVCTNDTLSLHPAVVTAIGQSSSGGLTASQVQALIDVSIATALASYAPEITCGQMSGVGLSCLQGVDLSNAQPGDPLIIGPLGEVTT